MNRLFVVLAVLLSACAQVAEEPNDVETAARALAVEECAHRVRCAGPLFARFWDSVAQCEERTALQYVKMMSGPTSGLTTAWAATCAAALAVDACAIERPEVCTFPSGTGGRGTSCLSGADCNATQTCTFRPIGFSPSSPLCGTCEPRRPRSDTPTAPSTTVATGSACDAAHVCDGRLDACVFGVCTAKQFAKPGEVCGKLPGGVTIHCGGTSMCSDREELGELGRCVPAAEDGRACDLTIGPGCLRPARCVSGVCAVPDVSACSAP